MDGDGPREAGFRRFERQCNAKLLSRFTEPLQGIPRLSVAGVEFATDLSYAYLTWAALALTLLVSYNVNSLVSDELYGDVSIYRPRFVSVTLAAAG